MNLKKAILTVMARDDLKAAIQAAGLVAVVKALARARAAAEEGVSASELMQGAGGCSGAGL